jgi:hypothetical protein
MTKYFTQDEIKEMKEKLKDIKTEEYTEARKLQKQE